MADDQISQMVADPDFAKLPIGEQRKALSAHDSTFSGANDDAIGQFVQAHQPYITSNEGLAGAAKPSVNMQELQPLDSVVSGKDVPYHPMPGSFEGHPENIGQYPVATAGRAAEGAVDMSRGNIKMGLHKELQAAGNAVAPMAPMLAGGAPLAFLRAGIGGAAGSKVASAGYKAVNPQDAAGQDLAGDVGGIAGGALGGGLPAILRRGRAALPNTEHAGQLFGEAAAGANKVPIDLTAPGNTALRIQEAAGRGGSMPKVVRDFINRTTKPGSTPLTYEEARDFYSNASRLSADESMRLTPNQKRMVGQFTRDLGNSIGGAADQAGVGQQYQGAMKEYRQASKLNDMMDAVKDNAVKIGLGAAGTGAAAYSLKQLLPFLRQK